MRERPARDRPRMSGEGWALAGWDRVAGAAGIVPRYAGAIVAGSKAQAYVENPEVRTLALPRVALSEDQLAAAVAGAAAAVDEAAGAGEAAGVTLLPLASRESVR